MRILRYWPPLAHLAFLAAVVLVTRNHFEPMPETPAAGSGPSAETRGLQPESDVFPLLAQTDHSALLDTIANLPLFGANRDVAEGGSSEPAGHAEDTAGTPVPDAAPEVQMLGFTEAGSVQKALVSTAAGTVETWVKKGDRVSGWTIIDIRSDQVTLRQGDLERTINMFR